MAADLSIHILEGCSESDLVVFFAHTMGSKHFNMMRRSDPMGAEWRRVSDSPQVWVGEVSWLKAALVGDSETFIPSTVGRVHEVISENLPVIDDTLIASVGAAFNLPNTTGYRLAERDKVIAFLESHRGKRAFTVSW